MTTISRVARLLRPLARPVGIAAVLSAIAMIFFGFYADNNVNYRKLVDSPIGRWLSGLNPQASTARVAADAGRIAADSGPSRANPIDSAFAELPDAPTTTMSACRSGPLISERNACAHESSGEGAESGGSVEAETPKSDTDPPWLASFAALMDSIAGQPPSTDPMATGDVPARAAAPHGALEADESARGISPDVALGATVPPQEPSTPLIKPVNPKVMALIESGKRAALKGDLDRAVRDFGEAIRIDPTYPDSYAERGQTLFRLGEVERAIADYSAALARDPQHGAALRARGMAYLYGGKTDVALADLSKTIELAEHDPRLATPIELFYARRSRSSIYDSKQQYDLEIADCTALIESYTHDPSLVEALTANYGSAGSANVLATIYRQRANAFIRRSNWERAVADLTEAIPLSSDRGYTALIDRSKVQEGLGRYNLAAADARAALDIRPGSEEARLMLDRVGAAAKPTSPKRL